jgi:pimeloyl-ACP methyl ester carboxylesterase/SAM-dependent methyltransferase
MLNNMNKVSREVCTVTPERMDQAGLRATFTPKLDRKVVIPLHGIRTHAEWQRAFVDVAQKHNLYCPLEKWNFGRFSLIRFLLPRQREAKIRWFRSAYDDLNDSRDAALGDNNLPSLVAHSFGTYIVGYALLKYKNIRFDKIILCGSILPTDFPWKTIIDRGQVRELRNEYGVKDFWVRRVNWFVNKAGSSGQSGFTQNGLKLQSDRIIQEEFIFEHSEYFNRGHMDQFWIPFLLRPSVPVSSRIATEHVPLDSLLPQSYAANETLPSPAPRVALPQKVPPGERVAVRPLSGAISVAVQEAFSGEAEHSCPLQAAGPSISGNSECPTQAQTVDGTLPPELRYSNVMHIGSIAIPYVPLLGGWESGRNEYTRGDVSVTLDTASEYRLPHELEGNQVDTDAVELGQTKCRLLDYQYPIAPGSYLVKLTFSRVQYSDYLKSGEFLDYRIPNDPITTFRDRFAQSEIISNPGASALTNITGVGVFIVTRDDKIIVSRHSDNVRVLKEVWSYSASGTMDWNPHLHPFSEIARECFEEIFHDLNTEDLRMVGFGLDTKRFYYQFSFLENSSRTAQDVLSKAAMARDFAVEMARLEAVPFKLDDVITAVKERAWEPAAAATLLTLCAKRYGLTAVERAIDPGGYRRQKREEMIAEWDQRACRPGDLAVMSVRYPSYARPAASTSYVEHVISFIGEDAEGKDVLEIGPGPGRLTYKLAQKARKMTCVDISGEMIRQNREHLDNLVNKVTFHKMFAQDYDRSRRHDVIVCSLVLVHNIDSDEFFQLTDVMSNCADMIFLFEHVDVNQQVSRFTRPRSEEELLAAFPSHRIAKRETHQLLMDNIVFLKLIKV